MFGVVFVIFRGSDLPRTARGRPGDPGAPDAILKLSLEELASADGFIVDVDVTSSFRLRATRREREPDD